MLLVRTHYSVTGRTRWHLGEMKSRLRTVPSHRLCPSLMEPGTRSWIFDPQFPICSFVSNCREANSSFGVGVQSVNDRQVLPPAPRPCGSGGNKGRTCAGLLPVPRAAALSAGPAPSPRGTVVGAGWLALGPVPLPTLGWGPGSHGCGSAGSVWLSSPGTWGQPQGAPEGPGL